jgi:hypothetical protein
MNYRLVQVVLAVSSSDEESAFWTQMLALVVLAVLLGIGSLIRTRTARFKYGERKDAGSARRLYIQQRWTVQRLKTLKDWCFGLFLRAEQTTVPVEEAVAVFEAVDTAGRNQEGTKSTKEKDLASGMELLGVDFLVSVVENTKGDGENDVTMRRLSFGELARREKLSAVDSNTLKVYATNKRRLYSRDIQCEAMRELAQRTKTRSL